MSGDAATAKHLSLPPITIEEISGIVQRRWYWAVVPMLLGAVAAFLLAAVSEPTYQSSATLLIASQEVPVGDASVSFSNYSDERIAKIRQRILSRENLVQLIQSLNLYAKEREKLPIDAVIEIARGATHLDLVSAAGPNAAHGQETTIAFNLSFAYRDPKVAQAVTDWLTGMFLREDKKIRTEQAIEAAVFMQRRAGEVRDRMVELETKRREVQARYAGALPDQLALSMQSSSALRAEVSRIDAETQGIAQQNSLLAARSEEIAATPDASAMSLQQAQQRVDQLSAIYSDDHPDVIAAKKMLALQKADGRGGPRGALAIQAEIAAGRSRISALAARRAGLVASVGQMDNLSAQAPQASYELNAVERDYDNLKREYQDIREKQMDAQVAANLQTENKGERFSVIDQPSLPSTPISPNTTKILGAGIGGGLMLGLLAILVVEISGGYINGEPGIIRLTGEEPLVIIPLMDPMVKAPFVSPFLQIKRRFLKLVSKPHG